MAEDELVTVQVFLNRFEAELALSALRSAGIDAMIRRDDCGGLDPQLWLNGLSLLVRAEDAETAGELLRTSVNEIRTDDRDE